MLTRLSVDNYVLIDSLEINFSTGLTIITGETGAGKSILLGALSLILGHRAESGIVKDPSRNCVVEASFDLSIDPGIAQLLSENEVESDSELLVRRVITPSGKSRAFVNDTPVGLPLLRQLGERLIDIHAQHENLLLRQTDFQLQLIDGYAGLDKIREAYQMVLSRFKSCMVRLDQQKALVAKGMDEQEYQRFQWEQLTSAKLREGELLALEEEQVALTHAQEIKDSLCGINHLLQEQEGAALTLIKDAGWLMNKIVPMYPSIRELYERLEGARIEIKDVCTEVERMISRVEGNPKRLEEVEQRLDTLYGLLRKHKRDSVEELISYRDALSDGFLGMDEAKEALDRMEKETQNARKELEICANNLSQSRKSALPGMETEVTERLRQLGIPHALIWVKIHDEQEYGSMGKDCPELLFSASKDVAPNVLAQVASGGELSRIMLCMKSLMVQSNRLPTIIFDEIDLGVSGSVADKMGEVLQAMSQNMQVIAITHLPQIASKGATHLTVYKVQDELGSRTCIKLLSMEDRVMEVARLLSGSKVTEAAINNAKHLLNYL